MSMSVELMRDYLLTKTKYAGTETWKKKVNGMSDKQVFAVYMRLIAQDRRS